MRSRGQASIINDMKPLLKALVFTFISLYVTQQLFQSFDFGGNKIKTWFLIVLALGLVNFFVRPILKIISFPTGGLIFMFLNFVLLLVILLVLQVILPDFKMLPPSTGRLLILGVVLPSKSLSALWAGVISAFLLGLIYNFFVWLSRK